jgi:AmiR/NasT family two-component response regulator
MAMQRDPVREWREQYARCCLRVDFEPLPGTTFHASVKPIFPDLGIIRTASSPGFVFRDEDLLRPDVPVITITAYGDAETKRKALENGAEALLTKPIDFITLRTEIDVLVQRAA